MGFQTTNNYEEDRKKYVSNRGIEYSPITVTEYKERDIVFFNGEADREPPYHVYYYLVIKDKWIRVTTEMDKRIGDDEWFVKVVKIEPEFGTFKVDEEVKSIAKEALYAHKNGIVTNGPLKYTIGE